jgi:hypothetical protein
VNLTIGEKIMITKYFSVTGNDCLTAKELTALIYSHYGEIAHGIIVSDIPPKTDKLHQPTVPIQFVWHDGVLYHETDCRYMGMGLEENCTVEQIGAVLYVRSKV